jgi:hypothetical protein
MASENPGMLRRTLEFFFPPAVTNRDELCDFIGGEASYLVQKTVIGYCRVKTVFDYGKLLTEPAFRDALEVCRWEGYARTLADMLILVEAFLRPADEPARTQAADALAALYPALLNQDIPPHRSDWKDQEIAFTERFAQSRLASPQPPDKVVSGTAKLLHELVPIHDRLKRNDLEVILGDLRLHTLAMHSAMQKRFRREPLLRALLQAPSD